MLYLDLFNKQALLRTPVGSITVPRDIDYIRRLFIFNRDAIQQYYLDRNFAVKNTNIISRVVEHLPTHLSYDVYRFLDSVDNQLTYLAKHFRFTSDIEKGVMHPDYFFGNDGEEIIFSGYEPVNATDYAMQWKTNSCIQVLKHNRNDDRYLLPLGQEDGNIGGLSSVFIDFPKLAIKWREFTREQIGREIQSTKNHFVIKHVLPPMMGDVIDHTLLNKVMDRFYDKPFVQPNGKHRFKLFDPVTQINRYMDNVLDRLSNKPMHFADALRHIKLVFSDSAAELLALPDFGATRQSRLAILSIRIDYMLFLLDVCKNPQSLNKHHLNDWKRLCERLERDSQLDSFFSYETGKALKEKMKRLKDAI